MGYRKADHDVALVNDQVAGWVAKMEPRHVALLIAKILNPDATLTALAGDMWPELAGSTRSQILSDANIMKIYPLIRDRPWVLAMIMSHKLAPVAMAVMYELMMSATKENVRVTAAKEIVRLAQGTWSKMMPSEEEPVPIEELEGLLSKNPDPVDVDYQVVEEHREEIDLLKT